MTTTTYNSGSGNFTVPAGVISLQIELWGGGAGGGAGDVDGGGNAIGTSGNGVPSCGSRRNKAPPTGLPFSMRGSSGESILGKNRLLSTLLSS